MKLFGEFLIEKNIVSEEALLSALMEQVSQLPSVSQIIYQNKLLPSPSILKAFSLQTKENIEFQAACEKLGFWNTKLESTIATELQKTKIPIGQLLVKQGAIDFQTITRALDEYFAEVNVPEIAQSEPVSAEVSVSHEAAGAEEAALLESSLEVANTGTTTAINPNNSGEPDFAPIDKDLLQNYGELLDANKVSALLGLGESLKTAALADDRAKAVTELLSQLAKGWHEIRGMGRFIKAPLTEGLAAATEDLILAGLKCPSTFEVAEADMMASLLADSLKMTGDIKTILLESSSEAGFWDSSKDSFTGLTRSLQSLQGFFSEKPAEAQVQTQALKEAA